VRVRQTGILAWRSLPGQERRPYSCGTAPALHRTFPDSSHVFGCPASIGRRLHCAGVRIVSLLPSATEIVCLLGLEDQLVGVSADSDWPVEVVKRQPVLNTVSIDTSQLTSKEIDTGAGDDAIGAPASITSTRSYSAIFGLVSTPATNICSVARDLGWSTPWRRWRGSSTPSAFQNPSRRNRCSRCPSMASDSSATSSSAGTQKIEHGGAEGRKR
jgi:hypothetical protein